MNPLTDLIFTLTWFTLFIFAIRSIWKGWKMMVSNPNKDLNFDVKKRKVTKSIHPEMSDVRQGDELMVINFTPDEEFVNRVKESDNYLQKSLQDRIDEIEDPWDNDDDDDGDVPSILKR
tara:strand:- start:337 stop:693 length:357 start_codon:yes stop_codon:yes gene_type:complete